MHTAARRTYLIGSVTWIVIGLLHTFTQVTELSTDAVEASFRSIGTVPVSGQEPEAWDLFQGTSYLMGFFALAIGANNIATLRALGPDALPPVGVCLTNALTLVAIGVVGALFLGPAQMIGGPIGVVLFGLPLVAHAKQR